MKLAENVQVTSRPNKRYNCFAWAAGESNRRWAPKDKGAFWPTGVERSDRVEAFIAAYATIGYAKCESGDLEVGYEKIALYTNDHSEPRHAARQLPNGKWTSKIGNWEDVSHDNTDVLEGDPAFANDPNPMSYGHATVFLKRRRNGELPLPPGAVDPSE